MNTYVPSWQREPMRSTIHQRAMTASQRRISDLLDPLPPKRMRTETSFRYSGSSFTETSQDNDALLVLPAQTSYNKVLETLETVDFSRGRAPLPQTLPIGIAKQVLSFLTVQRVQSDQVQAINCSSHDGAHPLSACLEDTDGSSHKSWWMADRNTMPKGRGNQWVQFQMDPNNNVCRVKSVSLKVPPMPDGPLSVRDFVLEGFSFERGWHAVSPIFTVSGNRKGWQRFKIPGEIDVAELRMVCLTNQFQIYVDRICSRHAENSNIQRQLLRFESVGFFAVRFD